MARVASTLALLLWSAPGYGQEPLESPQQVADEAIAKMLEQRCQFEVPTSYGFFEPKGVFTWRGPMGAHAKGSWKVQRGAVVVDATGRGGPCGGDDEDCDKPYPVEMRFSRIKVTDELVTWKAQTGPQLFRCRGKTGCDGEACVEVLDAVQIRAGSNYLRLYDDIRKHLAGWDWPDGWLVVDGPPTKHQRKTTQIWFQGDDDTAAWRVARALEPIVGLVKPKKWTWGGPYSVIVVTGLEDAPSAKKREPQPAEK